MKKFISTIITTVVLGALIWGCSPDKIRPVNQEERGAFGGAEAVPDPDTLHLIPLPTCGLNLIGQLAMEFGGNLYGMAGTHFLIVNDEEKLMIEIQAPQGWDFTEVALQPLQVGSTLPISGNQIDFSRFLYSETIVDAVEMYLWEIPIHDLNKKLTYSVTARIVNRNNPNQTHRIWLDGAGLVNGMGFGLDYTIAVPNCPGVNLPWGDSDD